MLQICGRQLCQMQILLTCFGSMLVNLLHSAHPPTRLSFYVEKFSRENTKYLICSDFAQQLFQLKTDGLSEVVNRQKVFSHFCVKNSIRIELMRELIHCLIPLQDFKLAREPAALLRSLHNRVIPPVEGRNRSGNRISNDENVLIFLTNRWFFNMDLFEAGKALGNDGANLNRIP